MLPVCIVLACFLAMFPASNGLLPKCDVTWSHLENYDGANTAIECSIKTPQTSNCTFDVLEVLPPDCEKEKFDYFMTYHLKLNCDNTQYRPIITNEQKRYCDNYISDLHIIKCGLLWQDLDVYAEVLGLSHLYLEHCKDRWDEEIVETDYWKNHQHVRGEDVSGITDSQIKPGVKSVYKLTIVNMDHIPGILQEFIWPNIFKLVFIKSQLSSSPLPTGLFENLPSLDTVDLSTNLLTTIHSGTFVNLPELEIIKLADNQLSYIADDAIST